MLNISGLSDSDLSDLHARILAEQRRRFVTSERARNPVVADTVNAMRGEGKGTVEVVRVLRDKFRFTYAEAWWASIHS